MSPNALLSQPGSRRFSGSISSALKRWWHAGLLAAVALGLMALEIPRIMEDEHLRTLAVVQAVGSYDFPYYVQAAERFVANPETLYLEKSQRTLTGFIYPPPAIVLFLPFLMLPRLWGYLLFVLLGYACIAVSIVLLTIRLMQESKLPSNYLIVGCITVIALASGPSYLNAIYGQVNGLVLLACTLFLWLSHKNHDRLAGLSLAIGIVLKIYPLLLLALGLVSTRHRRPAFYAVVLLIGICLTSAIYIPLTVWVQYSRDILPALSGRTIPHILNQSAVIGIGRLAGRLDGKQWVATGAYGGAFALTATLASLGIGVALCTAVALGRCVMAGAVLMCLMPMVSNLGWGYVYVVAGPILAAALIEAGQAGWVARLVCLLASLAWFVPAYKPMGRFVPGIPVVAAVLEERYWIVGLVLCVACPLWAAASDRWSFNHRSSA